MALDPETPTIYLTSAKFEAVSEQPQTGLNSPATDPST